MKYVLLLMAVCFGLSLTAQNHFLVELENRSPDVNAMVQAFEGTQPVPFQANDVLGIERSYFDMVGKTVLIWFWNNDCQKCIGQIDALNRLTEKYPGDLKVVSFSDNTKQEVLRFMEDHKIIFPVIANSKTLSEGPYGGDLGYPKFFMLDKSGNTKWVIPEQEMRGDFDAFNFFETLHISLQKS